MTPHGTPGIRRGPRMPRWGIGGHAGCRHRGESRESDERRAAQSPPTPTKTPDEPSVLTRTVAGRPPQLAALPRCARIGR